MKKITISFLSILILLFSNTLAVFANFSDIPANYKYANDINYVNKLGLVQEAAFKPDEYISRAEFAKWILKASGFNQTDYKPLGKKRFLDVSLNTYEYAPYIYRLMDLGALPLNSYFKPKNPITKKEALEWIFFIEGISIPKVFDENQFYATDINPKSAIAPIFNKAINLGMIDLNASKKGKAYPNAKLKRGQAAHFVKTVKNNAPTLTVTIIPMVESDMMKNPAFDTLVTVWNKIKDSYLRKDAVNKTNLIYGATEGIVKELGDKHSDFERPGDNAVVESLSGEIEGIGAVIQIKDDETTIVAPISGSPADKAGLMANDIIVEVDGVKTKGMKLTDIVAKIKGKKGTQVTLKIKRDSKILTFSITRDVVKIVSADLKITDDNIAIVTLANFGANLETEFKKIVEDIEKNKPKGIILDLRNNPGGYLNAAIDVSGYFIKKGEKVAIVRYPDKEDPQFSSGEGILNGYKIISLVNSGSASASEILVGALQDYGLTTVVGETTYGKGTVQELSDFINGATLKLTVAEWLTPKGRSIENTGIAPDITVKMTPEDKKAGKDPQMDKALEELRK